MPDEITDTPIPDSNPAPTASTAEKPVANPTRAQLTNVCAIGLGISFFLPWVNFFGAAPSGYDLQKMGGCQLYLWAIPVFSVIIVFGGVTGRSQRLAAAITGTLPFLVGGYWYHQLGSDLFHIITYGGFLSLLFGAALLILPGKAK